MLVPIAELGEANNRLMALVKQAAAGDEVIFTQQGQKIARLVPMAAVHDTENRRTLMERVRVAAAGKLRPGADAARSQDFLYGDDGMPV